VPESLRRHVRSAVRAVRPRPAPAATPRDRLVIGEVPTVNVRPRDPDSALAFLQDGVDRRSLLADETFAADGRREADAEALAKAVASYQWYHSIELPHGIVTPGAYDHRPLLPRYGIPADLHGKRVLDVATSDGFWAYEFERRGAKVTALDVETTSDLDLPARAAEVAAARGLSHPIGNGFAIAHRALGSSVERIGGTVYDLEPDRMGRFDLVHSGDLLCHLRDPCRALERIRSVTSGTGEALLAEVYDPSVESGMVKYNGGWEMVGWWVPSLDTLVQWVVDAGFSSVEVVTVYNLSVLGESNASWRAVMRARP
jgi:tRNA (mo5U34)-methyltransferase